MTDTLIGALIGAAATIVAELIGLISYKGVQTYKKTKIKQVAKGDNNTQIGVQSNKGENNERQ